MSIYTQSVSLSLNAMRKNRKQRAQANEKLQALDKEYASLYKLVLAHEEHSGETYLNPEDPEFIPPVISPILEIHGSKISRRCVSLEELIIQILLQRKTEAMSIDDVHSALHQNGYAYSYAHVTGRVYNLNSQKRISRVSRGRYIHPDFVKDFFKSSGEPELTEAESKEN